MRLVTGAAIAVATMVVADPLSALPLEAPASARGAAETLPVELVDDRAMLFVFPQLAATHPAEIVGLGLSEGRQSIAGTIGSGDVRAFMASRRLESTFGSGTREWRGGVAFGTDAGAPRWAVGLMESSQAREDGRRPVDPGGRRGRGERAHRIDRHRGGVAPRERRRRRRRNTARLEILVHEDTGGCRAGGARGRVRERPPARGVGQRDRPANVAHDGVRLRCLE